MKIEQLETEVVYTGPRFTVKRGDFRHDDDGKVVTREWIEPGHAVAVLPFDTTWFYLAKQPREVTGRTVLSLCAGKLDAGEDSLTAAKRELAEETGLAAKKWTYVTKFYTSEGITDEQTTLYFAEELTQLSPDVIDRDEKVKVVPCSLEELDWYTANADNAKAKIALMALQRRRLMVGLSLIAESLEFTGASLRTLDDD